MKEFLSKIGGKNLDLNPKEKEKKTSRSLFILNKKRKRKTERSAVANAIKELSKRKINNVEGVQAYFLENRKVVGEKEAKFYNTILSMKVVNNNIRLSDVLTNKPIYGYYCDTKMTSFIISNDVLYSNALFFYRTEKEKADDLFKECAYVDQVSFCSLPFMCTGDVKKGYYQDFSGTFAAIGYEGLSEEEKKKIIGGEGEKIKFNYNDIEYLVFHLSGCTLVYPSKLKGNTDEIKNMCENMKTISVSGSRVILNDKSFKVNNKVRYVDSVVKTQDFCPAFLEMPESTEFSVLFRIVYDYNKLYDEIKNICQKQQLLKFPRNMFYWDTMHQCFDFIGVLAVTGKNFITPENQKNLALVYDNYIKLKDVLDLWKQNQLLFQRCIKEFYSSFNNIVNYDKLIVLRDKIRDYMEMYNALTNDETYDEITTLINSCHIFRMCDCIHKQMNFNLFSLAQQMYNVITAMNNADVRTLVNDLRQLGFAIYNLTYVPSDKPNAQMFPFIVSPGAFLGNVLGGNVKFEDDPLVEIVTSIQNKVNKINSLEDSVIQTTNYVANNRERLQENNLAQSLDDFLSTNQIAMEDEDKKIVIKQIQNELPNNQNISSQLNNAISQSVIQGDKEGKSVVMNPNLIGDYAKRRMLEIQARNIQQNQDRNRLNMEINNLQKAYLDNRMYSDEPTSTGSKNIPITQDIVMQNETFLGTDNQIMDRIRENITTVDINPVNFNKWYCDLLVKAGQLDMYSYPAAIEVSSEDLLETYPLSNEEINKILSNFSMPSISEVMREKIYYQKTPIVKITDAGKTKMKLRTIKKKKKKK